MPNGFWFLCVVGFLVIVSPNGQPWLDETDVIERPRPLLERKSERSFLKGLGWGFLIATPIWFLCVVGFLVIQTRCQ